jgi:hypothetical protein
MIEGLTGEQAIDIETTCVQVRVRVLVNAIVVGIR